MALRWPLIALELAIACYVASEVGVSNWLIRFLEDVPLATATTSLSLFWGGLAVGRLVSARYSDRFDHLRDATVSALAAGVATIAAAIVPTTEASIALFAVVGFASAPIFPLIIAIGGERHPGRSAAVSGFLTSAAVRVAWLPAGHGVPLGERGPAGRDGGGRAPRCRLRGGAAARAAPVRARRGGAPEDPGL